MKEGHRCCSRLGNRCLRVERISYLKLSMARLTQSWAAVAKVVMMAVVWGADEEVPVAVKAVGGKVHASLHGGQ